MRVLRLITNWTYLVIVNLAAMLVAPFWLAFRAIKIWMFQAEVLSKHARRGECFFWEKP